LTLREIAWLHDARRARNTMTDWQTARIVAMLAAVNSKQRRYDPVRFMSGGDELRRASAEARANREPMTGDQILARFRQLGVQIIDKRAKRE